MDGLLAALDSLSNAVRLRAVVLSDDFIDPGVLSGLLTSSTLLGFNETNFDRIRSRDTSTDAQTSTASGALLAQSRLYGFNGSTWDRMRALGDNAANPALGKLPTLPARANAAAPAWTEGRVVPISEDLSGNVRVDPSDRAAREAGRVRPYGNALTEGSGELTAPAAGSLIAELGAIPASDRDVFWSCMAADTVAVGKRVRILHTNSADTILHQFGGCPATNSNVGFHNRVSFALNDKIRALTGAAGAAGSTYQAYIAHRVAG